MTTNLKRSVTGALCVSLAVSAVALAEDENLLTRGRASAPGWIHDDLEAAYAQARSTGKPLLIQSRHRLPQ